MGKNANLLITNTIYGQSLIDDNSPLLNFNSVDSDTSPRVVLFSDLDNGGQITINYRDLIKTEVSPISLFLNYDGSTVNSKRVQIKISEDLSAIPVANRIAVGDNVTFVVNGTHISIPGTTTGFSGYSGINNEKNAATAAVQDFLNGVQVYKVDAIDQDTDGKWRFYLKSPSVSWWANDEILPRVGIVSGAKSVSAVLASGGSGKVKDHLMYSVRSESVTTKLIASAGNTSGGTFTVRLASTGTNINLASPGASLDGSTMNLGDRILVKNQTLPAQNGIYVFNGASAAMTRATDFDSSNKIGPASLMVVSEGSTNADQLWELTANAPITLDTTALPFLKLAPSAGGAGALNVVSYSSNQALAGTEDTVLVDTTSGPVTITLALANNADVAKRNVTIVDKAGTSATNNITVLRAGSNTINGATSGILNANRMALTFASDQTSAYYII